jgi:hypothetical protein
MASESVTYGDNGGDPGNLQGLDDEFDDDDDIEDADTPLENVAAAAEFALSLLRSIDATMQTFAIAGGVAVVMRGSERVTEDVDILFKGPLPRLYRLLLLQARYVERKYFDILILDLCCTACMTSFCSSHAVLFTSYNAE